MKMTYHQIRYEKYCQNKFSEWRKRVNKRLPGIAARIFALREVAYSGFGYHWELERRLGNIISLINDYDRIYHITDQVGIEVSVYMLFKDVDKAEKSRF